MRCIERECSAMSEQAKQWARMRRSRMQGKRLPKVEQEIWKFRHFSMPDDVFRVFSCSVVVVQGSVSQCYTRVIEQDTWTEKEKALRVPPAVNIGWRFTARMQFDFNMAVKIFHQLVRKTKISQNPWIRLTSKQFSYFRYVLIYPGIHPLCLSMRFRKISLGG